MMRIQQHGIRRILTGAVSALLLHSTSANIIPADVELWAGSGVNESLLVIDWQDGSDALLWGFRWEGSATGEDMLTAIEARDPRLDADITVHASLGAYFNAMGFDSNQDGTDESFAASDWTGGSGPTTTSWGYYDGGALGNTWTDPGVGMSSRNLTHGSIEAWSYGTHDGSWTHVTPPASNLTAASFVAIPEPSVLASFLGGLLLLRLRRCPR